MSDRKLFVAFQNLNKLQTLSLCHECFFFLILCLKIIQHGTINSAYIYTHTYIYTFLKNDGLNYTFWTFLIFRKYISYIDFINFNLFQLFFYFKFLPYLSQCIYCYSTSDNLKLISLENEILLLISILAYILAL